MKTITLELPDTPHTRKMLQYLRDQVVQDEMEHWNSEFNDAPSGTQEEERARGMLEAWENLEGRIEDVVRA